MRADALARRASALISLCFLGACASFDGHPVPVLDAAELTEAARREPLDTVLINFYAPNDSDRRNLSRENYRNMIIGTHIAAADARYLSFRRSLSRQTKSSSLGLELLALGLSSGASIASQSAANALSAGAAAANGTRASISREVYFERTLAALLAGMDAERLRVRATIVEQMQRSADEYPLPVAFADLARYEAAASLDGAIERVTGAASADAAQAAQAYNDTVLSLQGPSETGVAAVRTGIRATLRDLETRGDIQTLNRIARVLDLEPAAGAGDTARLIARRFLGATTLAEAERLRGLVTAAVQEGR